MNGVRRCSMISFKIGRFGDYPWYVSRFALDPFALDGNPAPEAPPDPE